MRRILLGGLGLAFGVFAAPVAAQDGRGNSPQNQPPVQRVARLGRPTAIPEAPAPDSGVTPAGLLRGSPQPTVPTPMPGSGGTGGATGAPTGGAAPPGGTAPPPRAVLGTPTVVEDRGAAGGVVVPHGGYGYPSGISGIPGLPPGATIVPGSEMIVPSVTPGGIVAGPMGTENPFGADCPTGGCPTTGAPALARVGGCGRWVVSGEYLMWWTRAATVPALVTTSSPQFNGILGQGDTRTLVGGTFGQTLHSGARFSAVRWFGDGTCRGLDGRIFFLGQAASSLSATTSQFPLLARPFNNINVPVGPFSEVVAATGLATGGVNVQLENTVWGAEANYRRNLFGNPCARVDAIIGYRYLNMTEKLTITEGFNRAATANNPFVSGTIIDSFRTANHFHGGQIGLVGEIHRGRWSLDGRVSVAFGNLHRSADISGGQALIRSNGSTVTANGGLLALPGANIGHFSDNVFAVVPEVGVTVGYQLTSRLRCFVGYNFLYLGNALRPGNVIDPYIDAARIPNFPLSAGQTPLLTNPIHPTPQFRSSGFFVQGISFGLQFNW